MKTTKIILLAFAAFCFAKIGFAQMTSLPSTPVYQLKEGELRQELPPLTWIIEEGEETLSAEDLRQGNLKDAKILLLKEGEKVLILETKSYWYKINLQSNVPKYNENLSVNFTGLDGGFVFSFKEVNAYSFINDQLVETGL